MRVAVTGAGGYVGSAVAGGLAAAGWQVRALSRPSFSLEDGPSPGAFDGVDALVHCAWDFDARSTEAVERVNVAGSRRALDAAAGAGVRTILFVSTLSAFPGCRSLYGRAKLAVEGHAASLGATVVRPGLVWGEHPGGLYAAVRRLSLALPVVPVFTGENRKLHLAHEEDLAKLVAHLLVGTAPTAPVVAAALEPLSLGEIVRRVARADGRNVGVVRIPWQPVWAGLRLLELAGMRPPFRSDSVVSLVSLDQEPFRTATRPDPVEFRPFDPR